MEERKTYGMSLHGVKVSVCVGIREHEKKTPQPIEMDVDLIIEQPDFFEDDHVSRVVPSYSDMRALLVDNAKKSHTGLLEVLALNLVTICLEAPGVMRVRLKIAKPMALKGGVASVVFEGANGLVKTGSYEDGVL